ncbi:outer membrane efflux protein [Bacteroides coprosuis DSM 18011]|uniref:Outer membrane efflux protein n=1 Tax=Bacteroides coprosuis DSM 18011 TaxID=679937 RepID=F3ZSV5_9BACE|nr:TolC family protein [Bacteroides coprosuis]EGJ72196.1 outer membrane efflux protein [Bacteroides coprosuis DSM 18011]
MILLKNKWLIGLIFLLLSTQAKSQRLDSLDHYLRIAAENNPEVLSSFANYQAAWHKIPEVKALDDPTLDIGFFLKPMDIVGGRQVADFTLMQMFPWFGTKKAARNEATHMAKAAYEQFRESRDAVFLQVYSQWYKLLALQEQLKNNQENKTLLEQLRTLAQRKFASPQSTPTTSYILPATTNSNSTSSSNSSGGMSGMSDMSSSSSGNSSSTSMVASSEMSNMGGTSSTGMSEVLRIELEIMELEDNIKSIESQLLSAQGIFNTLLNRPLDYPIVLPNAIEQVVFVLSSDMETQIRANNPMLAMLEQERNAYIAMGKMNKKMGLPMIGLGVQYMLINKTRDPMLAMGNMNGNDMIMPMISISLPIYRGKYKAQQHQSKWMQQMAIDKYRSTLNTLQNDVNLAKNKLEDASRKISLYKKQSNLAQTTYTLAIREYTSGKNDLTNIIQVQRQLLDYKLKEAQAIADYNIQVATIQKAISYNQIIKEDSSL